jgi:SAM-dependent methyltransferase
MQADEYRKMFALEENFWWYRGMLDITRRLLGRYCRTNDNFKILDAGCGTGKMLLELRQFTPGDPFGLDYSAEAMKFLKVRAVPNVLQASTTELPFAADSFDLVTSFDVLCQLPGDGDLQALREFHRVLNPRGKIYVRLPAYQWMFANHDRCSLTVHRYTRSELVAKVQTARFRILKASYANFFLFPPLAFKRIALEKMGILAESSDLRPVPPFLNTLLEIPLRLEAQLLNRKGFRFPYGVSLLCLAEKS